MDHRGPERTSFKEGLRALRAEVLRHVDVVVTTCTNSNCTGLYENFFPNVIYFGQGSLLLSPWGLFRILVDRLLGRVLFLSSFFLPLVRACD